MEDGAEFERPRWAKDVLRYLPLKPQFVLSGNIRDHHLLALRPGAVAAQPLLTVLAHELRGAGYAHILAYDPVQGFRIVPQAGDDPAAGQALLGELGLQAATHGFAPAGVELFAETLVRFANRTGAPAALLADFASRLVVRHEALTSAEHQAFTRSLLASHTARAKPFGTPPRPFFNSVFWIVDKEGDLPDWFLVDNPRIRHVPVPRPDHRARRQLAAALLRGFDGHREADADAISDALAAFVESTEGLLLTDLSAIAELARAEALRLNQVRDAVRRYKVGVTEDPWARLDRKRVRDGGGFVRVRVKGQDHAVTHMLDIIKRAVTGVGAPRRGGRPRGVAFLAGPTGVGKTELAKTLTSLLFGDESAYIRFDMSEFSAEHSDQRLIGAPPGYVGYDVGGELTNAIREKPFSVVLFDEIEKAHPRILDKFLQVLDDGVLTSGRGDRVYFSEAFIIFTSNLGIYRQEADGSRSANVAPGDDFADVQRKVRSEIDRHFKQVLNRPEILNRIGDNILVFDFIRPEIAQAIFDGMVDAVLADVAANQNIHVALADEARAALRDACLSDLSNGGRGIRNKVESLLVNPLARALFDTEAAAGARLAIATLRVEGGVTDLTFGADAGQAVA
ncbi:AAA family ATPase [Methylobacterium sp. WL9]|uniref:AAA family ATPase n=1 Tax=Methylobacterium sp. WL9 TaxID=2603898 RepID=UPI0011CA68A8|nr:AAA family ATPase [Methylobacterium sp. WL9]TXN20393.1 AAA domain-containing protein [Methylobacterium sp. WL9]